MSSNSNATKILGNVITGTTGTTSTNLVYSTSPTLVTPDLGTPSALVGTNITGTASGLTAGSVTNATFTTALTVNTGTLTLTANAANTSVLTIGAGAVSVSGANTGDQTITLTGDVTGAGTGSFATTIADAAVTYAKFQNVAANAFVGRANSSSGVTAAVCALGASQLAGRGSTGNLAAISLNTSLTMSTTTLGLTSRTIGGVAFDGTANITVATATGGFTVSGGDLALGANNITMSGSIGTTGTRLTKGWFTDLEVTNAIVGSITGSAPTLTTARAIYGNNFDGSAALTQVIASTYGGTGNGFTKFSGPATAEKTFTLPNANATILTDNAAVTVAQGGTGLATLTANNVILGNGTSSPSFVAPGTSGNVLTSNGTTWTSAASSSGWVPISTQTANNDASITVTFSGSYDEYEISAVNLVPSVDNRDVYITLGNDTGATDYTYFGIYGDSASDTVSSIRSTGDTKIIAGDDVGSAAGECCNIVIRIKDPLDASYKTQVTYVTITDDGEGAARIFYGGGFRTAAEASSTLEIKFNTGDIVVGSITLMGRNNA